MDAQEGRESCASCAQIESHDVEGQGRRGGDRALAPERLARSVLSPVTATTSAVVPTEPWRARTIT
jgi:hypothetical protein